MAGFTPTLHETRKDLLDITKFPAGTNYGKWGRVAENDSNRLLVCYDWSPANCADCTVTKCPLNRSGSKES